MNKLEIIKCLTISTCLFIPFASFFYLKEKSDKEKELALKNLKRKFYE